MHDAVVLNLMPEAVLNNVQLYCDCVGDAVSINDYVRIMQNAGLSSIDIVDFTEEGKR